MRERSYAHPYQLVGFEKQHPAQPHSRAGRRYKSQLSFIAEAGQILTGKCEYRREEAYPY